MYNTTAAVLAASAAAKYTGPEQCTAVSASRKPVAVKAATPASPPAGDGLPPETPAEGAVGGALTEARCYAIKTR